MGRKRKEFRKPRSVAEWSVTILWLVISSWLFIGPFLTGLSTMNWVEVPVTIKEAPPADAGAKATSFIAYTYHFNGAIYTTTKKFSDHNRVAEFFRFLQPAYRDGQWTTGWVNPQAPNDSTLARFPPYLPITAFFPFGLGFVGISCWRRWRGRVTVAKN